MKKTLIALAAVAVSSAAMAQVTISGKYAVAYQKIETAAGKKSSGFNTTDGDIVFSGTEDIEGGMKAGASLALRLRGRVATAADSVNGRDASVFLQGGFGRLTMGSVEAGNGIIGRASAGAPVIGQDGNVTLDGGTNVDMASLSLPLATGLTATVMLIDSIGSPGTAGMEGHAATQDATLFGLAYAAGPISVGFDSTSFGQNAAAAATGTDSRMRVSASFNLGVAMVGAGYQTKETFTGVADKQMMVGVSVPMGAITVGATYAVRDNDVDTADATGYELGANYAFSKRTNLQTAYLSQSVNKGADATTIRVRLMHAF